MSNQPMPFQRPTVALLLVAAVTLASGSSVAHAGAPPVPGGAGAPQPGAARAERSPAALPDDEIDRLVQAAFDQRRAAEWQRLGDFVLRETLAIAIDAPFSSPLAGFRRAREYEWFVRDGWAVRSPVRVDGVVVGEERRGGYAHCRVR